MIKKNTMKKKAKPPPQQQHTHLNFAEPQVTICEQMFSGVCSRYVLWKYSSLAFLVKTQKVLKECWFYSQYKAMQMFSANTFFQAANKWIIH